MAETCSPSQASAPSHRSGCTTRKRDRANRPDRQGQTEPALERRLQHYPDWQGLAALDRPDRFALTALSPASR
jgi:hypothetical protein